MSSVFYSRVAPDYGDLDNVTGTRPPHLVEVHEKDGGVGVFIYEDETGRTGTGYQAVFLNVDEAEDLLRGLTDAIKRARPKQANHPPRVRDTM